jgi:uncharacterized tellurite resistance protein B-like protein
MSVFDIFESNDSKKRKSHLRNLVALAKLDGFISKEEFSFLLKVGDRAGVTSDEVKKMMLRTTTIKVSKPDNNIDRFDLLYDLLEMTLADGVMDENEIDFCIDMAVRLGFRPAISGVLVRMIAVDMMEACKKDQIREKANSYLLLKQAN